MRRSWRWPRVFAAVCLLTLLVGAMSTGATPAPRGPAGLPTAQGKPLLVAVKTIENDPEGTSLAAVRSHLGTLPFVRLAEGSEATDVVLSGSVAGKLTVRVCTAAGVTTRTCQGASFADVAAEITMELRRLYSFAWLSRLHNPHPTFSVTLRAGGAGAEGYRVGDVVRFHFRSQRDCYLTLVDIGTSGKATVLYPNQYHQDTFVAAGQEVTIPEETFKIRAQGPPGLEMVVAVATTRPCELSALLPGNPRELFRNFSDPLEFRRIFVTSLSKGIVPQSAPTASAGPVQWAEASAVFFIR